MYRDLDNLSTPPVISTVIENGGKFECVDANFVKNNIGHRNKKVFKCLLSSEQTREFQAR